MYELLLAALAAGVIGTIVMDLGNYLCFRTGIALKIEVRMIGRMAAGWVRGRFFYNHPEEMTLVRQERLLGYLAHYAIGVTLAMIYVYGWHFLIGGPASATWALLYGIATTAASHFFVYPAMGFGVCGLKSPDGLKATFSALLNHFFFGLGMALSVGLI